MTLNPLNRYIIPTILISAISPLAIVQQVAIAIPPTEISQQAKQYTVQINGLDFLGDGSGVIVGRNGNTYQVLTNWHVVSESSKTTDYAITTKDDRSYPVMCSN